MVNRQELGSDLRDNTASCRIIRMLNRRPCFLKLGGHNISNDMCNLAINERTVLQGNSSAGIQGIPPFAEPGVHYPTHQ
jgi:hypothetical protein